MSAASFLSTELSYIQLEKYSLFNCSLKVRELLSEMPQKCMFCEPKNTKEEKDYPVDSCTLKSKLYAKRWAYKISYKWQSSSSLYNDPLYWWNFWKDHDTFVKMMVIMSSFNCGCNQLRFPQRPKSKPNPLAFQEDHSIGSCKDASTWLISVVWQRLTYVMNCWDFECKF